MEHQYIEESNHCGDRGLYVNRNGQLIDPVIGEVVYGVGVPQVDDLDRFFNILDEDID